LSTAIAIKNETVIALTALIDRASSALAGARSAAEVLEARDMASIAYDAAKKAARFGKAKQAHDDLIAAAYRAQADALEIEAGAKRRLADEYDAAQERGEVKSNGGARNFTVPKQNSEPSASDIGLSRKDIHESRIIRDAEKADPGIVRRTVDAAIAGGKEPTKAAVRRAVLETARPQSSPKPAPGRGKDAIRERVLEAIVILSGLPPAHEVVAYFAGTDTAIIVSERIRTATAWLAEFSDAWKDDEC
jgi:hypothetical protein